MIHGIGIMTRILGVENDMSGGHFQYKQWEIGNIADEIEQLIIDNDSDEKNQWGDTKGRHFNPETIKQFQVALDLLRMAHVFVHRIDWLVSGDDSEESFHKRLEKDFADLADLAALRRRGVDQLPSKGVEE